MQRLHLIVQGRVQGVGFRWFVVREARRAGVTGWVANCPDGSVETEAEGGRTELESFLAAVRKGPPASRVDHVEAAWSEGIRRYQEFDVSI